MSSYPPRRCGVASFTHDLAAATGDREIVALHPPGSAAPYPLEVHHRIRRDEPADYIQTAQALDRCVDVVSIQFSSGIWGGDDGAFVTEFTRGLRLPAVATLHTVPEHPTMGQRQTIGLLIDSVAATIVMSPAAARLLTSVYGADRKLLEVVAHGVPDLPLVDPEKMKPGLGVEGRDVLVSFGLLGPGKGYELAIDALPQVVAAHPTALYAIVGSTHPDLVRDDGETYRDGLVARVRRLGMQDHVQFEDRFVGRVERTRWLQAADIVLTPYMNLDQTISSTLACAMGAGRMVVSTPFAYARDLLADGRGILIEPDSPGALGAAVIEALDDPAHRAAVGRRAHEYSRDMVWSAVGAEYLRVLRAAAGGGATQVTRVTPARGGRQAAFGA